MDAILAELMRKTGQTELYLIPNPSIPGEWLKTYLVRGGSVFKIKSVEKDTIQVPYIGTVGRNNFLFEVDGEPWIGINFEKTNVVNCYDLSRETY